MKIKKILQVDFEPPKPELLAFEINRLEDMPLMVKSSVPHRHNFYELVWVVQGTGVHQIDFKDYLIHSNTLFFLPLGVVHRWQLTTDFTGFCMLFTNDFLAMLNNHYQIADLLPFLNIGYQNLALALSELETQELAQIVQGIENEYKANLLERATMLKLYVQTFFVSLSRILTSQGYLSSRGFQPLVHKFMNLLEENFSQEKQSGFYAKSLGVTPNYLNEVVQSSLGKTTGEIIRERVVIEAKRLLFHSDQTVLEIGYQLGFDNPSYFCRFFARYTHLTPNQFRAINREKYHANL